MPSNNHDSETADKKPRKASSSSEQKSAEFEHETPPVSHEFFDEGDDDVLDEGSDESADHNFEEESVQGEESAGITVKLHKYLAECGVASRRKSEQLILAGRVNVDGAVERNVARRIDPASANVKVEGRNVRPPMLSLAFALYKPKGCVCTMSDPEGRPTIAEYFPNVKTRLFTVGRLDYDTEGLIIVTNDGGLANSISHPSRHIWKTYFVKVKEVVTQQMLDAFDREPVIDNVKRQRIKLKLIHHINDKTWIEVRLQEGVNRQIKKMFSAEGWRVLKIKRVTVGPVSIEDLSPGEFRPLRQNELDVFLGNSRS